MKRSEVMGLNYLWFVLGLYKIQLILFSSFSN